MSNSTPSVSIQNKTQEQISIISESENVVTLSPAIVDKGNLVSSLALQSYGELHQHQSPRLYRRVVRVSSSQEQISNLFDREVIDGEEEQSLEELWAARAVTIHSLFVQKEDRKASTLLKGWLPKEVHDQVQALELLVHAFTASSCFLSAGQIILWAHKQEILDKEAFMDHYGPCLLQAPLEESAKLLKAIAKWQPSSAVLNLGMRLLSRWPVPDIETHKTALRPIVDILVNLEDFQEARVALKLLMENGSSSLRSLLFNKGAEMVKGSPMRQSDQEDNSFLCEVITALFAATRLREQLLPQLVALCPSPVDGQEIPWIHQVSAVFSQTSSLSAIQEIWKLFDRHMKCLPASVATEAFILMISNTPDHVPATVWANIHRTFEAYSAQFSWEQKFRCLTALCDSSPTPMSGDVLFLLVDLWVSTVNDLSGEQNEGAIVRYASPLLTALKESYESLRGYRSKVHKQASSRAAAGIVRMYLASLAIPSLQALYDPVLLDLLSTPCDKDILDKLFAKWVIMPPSDKKKGALILALSRAHEEEKLQVLLGQWPQLDLWMGSCHTAYLRAMRLGAESHNSQEPPSIITMLDSAPRQNHLPALIELAIKHEAEGVTSAIGASVCKVGVSLIRSMILSNYPGDEVYIKQIIAAVRKLADLEATDLFLNMTKAWLQLFPVGYSQQEVKVRNKAMLLLLEHATYMLDRLKESHSRPCLEKIEPMLCSILWMRSAFEDRRSIARRRSIKAPDVTGWYTPVLTLFNKIYAQANSLDQRKVAGEGLFWGIASVISQYSSFGSDNLYILLEKKIYWLSQLDTSIGLHVELLSDLVSSHLVLRDMLVSNELLEGQYKTLMGLMGKACNKVLSHSPSDPAYNMIEYRVAKACVRFTRDINTCMSAISGLERFARNLLEGIKERPFTSSQYHQTNVILIEIMSKMLDVLPTATTVEEKALFSSFMKQIKIKIIELLDLMHDMKDRMAIEDKSLPEKSFKHLVNSLEKLSYLIISCGKRAHRYRGHKEWQTLFTIGLFSITSRLIDQVDHQIKSKDKDISDPVSMASAIATLLTHLTFCNANVALFGKDEEIKAWEGLLLKTKGLTQFLLKFRREPSDR